MFDGKSDIIDTNNIEENDEIINFKEFMSNLKEKLNDSIQLINNNEVTYDKIKNIIEELKNNDEIFVKIEFNSPRFENANQSASKTIKFLEKYKEFKLTIRGKLEELFNAYYNYLEYKVILKNNIKLMDNSFAIFKAVFKSLFS